MTNEMTRHALLKELERNQKLLNKFERIARVGSWELDLQTKEVVWSDTLREIYEADPDFIPTMENLALFCTSKGCTTTTDPWEHELEIKTAKGQHRWVRTKGVPHKQNGKTVRLSGTIQDITQRKHALLELTRRQEADFTLAEVAREMLTLTSTDSIATLVLNTARKLSNSQLGVAGSLDQHTDKLRIHQLTTDKQKSCPIAAKNISVNKFDGLWPAYIREGKPIMSNNPPSDLSSVGLPKDHPPIKRILAVPAMLGDEVVGLLALANGSKPYDNSHLQIVQRLASLFAIALERVRMADILLRTKDQAETANNAKSDFLAKMSHELRTPMNAIVNMTGMAQRTELTVQQRDLLETVQDSAERLTTIINNILDLSQIESGRMHLQTSNFDLVQLLLSTIESMTVQAEHKGLKLNLDLDKNVPHMLRGDSDRLRQALVNLIGNALKFTAKGSVTVAARLEDTATKESGVHHQIAFSVTDTGSGIPEDKQEIIFDSFTQADDSIRRQFGGPGLGLSIARQLVERMGGRIWLKSQLGQGSAFHFVIPFAPGLAEIDPAKDPSPNKNIASQTQAAKDKTTPPPRQSLDVVAALNLIDGNMDLYEAIFNSFKSRHTEFTEAIDKALDQNDLGLARLQAHTLKSLSGQVGAHSCAELSRKLEHATRDGYRDLAIILLEKLTLECAEVATLNWQELPH